MRAAADFGPSPPFACSPQARQVRPARRPDMGASIRIWTARANAHSLCGMRAEPLLITLGDANGLGPELACRLLSGRLPAHLTGRALLLLGAEASLRAHLSFAGGTPFWTRVGDPARALAADAPP
ncbi:4-hydroxythreonine-4-phosphate dehydrogenase domain protein, partial [Desulfovibrio sp. A2]